MTDRASVDLFPEDYKEVQDTSSGFMTIRMCRCLRTKEVPLRTHEPTESDSEHSIEAFYYCLHTDCSCGPDSHPAEPQECKPNRKCFEE